MADRPKPVFQTSAEILLIGRMAVYNSQTEASQSIPRQWRSFLQDHPSLRGTSPFYGASPCTGDGRIHYLCGVVHERLDVVPGGETLTLDAGEYAVVRVDDPASLRDTWIWLLGTWLANSGRRERKAPEFERYAGVAEDGTPIGPVEIWIPLEPAAQ